MLIKVQAFRDILNLIRYKVLVLIDAQFPVNALLENGSESDSYRQIIAFPLSRCGWMLGARYFTPMECALVS